jgi:hypothetical protein
MWEAKWRVVVSCLSEILTSLSQVLKQQQSSSKAAVKQQSSSSKGDQVACSGVMPERDPNRPLPGTQFT